MLIKNNFAKKTKEESKGSKSNINLNYFSKK